MKLRNAYASSNRVYTAAFKQSEEMLMNKVRGVHKILEPSGKKNACTRIRHCYLHCVLYAALSRNDMIGPAISLLREFVSSI
jgi:Pyruvate/2-oxoacid:ferredoxin oxidoreductase delta subunit